jgi:hypothetical protein
MLKKLVGLGLVFSVATLTSALSGGCTTTTTSTTDGGDTTGGGGKTDSGVVHKEGGTVDPGTEAGTSSGACPAPVDTTMIPAWKAPKTGSAGSCSDTEIAAINTKAMDANATFTDLYNAITSAGCKSCVFSSEMDANWQPIVWSPDMASGTAFVNFGACYDVAPSGSAACGKGVQDDEFCLTAACPTTCTDQMGCVSAADTGACKAQGDEVTSGCGSALTQLNAKCSKFISGLTVVCGAGAGDGGTTDAADDGG